MATDNKTHEYTLSDLFSGDRKIVIPDLQRDYCWGGSGNKLVGDFVGNLINQHRQGVGDYALNLGVIYGYEQPKDHIQLCDGQQRITTLFLLLGMLNRKSAGNEFQELLISDRELNHDDKEPYLQYAIRESSLYFISDLVCHFFLTDEIVKVGDISRSSWYFNDYRYDPSIQSMLQAMETIEGLLADKSEQWCSDFGNFLTTRLRFLYYDLGNRSNGEETFVVINTTGEPLSVTQNLKPLVCGASINARYAACHNIYEQWEEMENWFWLKRRNNNDTADAGFNEFLRWVTIINADDDKGKDILQSGKYVFPTEDVAFAQIRGYWQALGFLFDRWSQRDKLDPNWLSPAETVIRQIDCFRIIPLIVYCQRWQISDPDDVHLLRFYRFIENLSNVGNVSKAVNDLVAEAIRIAGNCRDIIELLTNGLKISDTLLSGEERLKLQILHDDINHREQIEQAFWRAQALDMVHSHNIWSGQIMPLLKWATTDGVFSLSAFERYLEIFDRTFNGECKANIDPVRRALLTRSLKQYPRIFRGNVVYSLGWAWKEWQILINDNIDVFKAFFDDLRAGVTLQAMIENYHQDVKIAAVVHEPKLLSFCEQKKLQWYSRNWYLMKGERFSGDYANISAYAYYCCLQNNNNSLPNGWKRGFWKKGLTCVYYDYERVNLPSVAIDIVWNAGNKNDMLEIDLFDRGKDEAKRQEQLQPVADKLGYKWQNGRFRKSVNMKDREAKELMEWADCECNLLFRQIPQYIIES